MVVLPGPFGAGESGEGLYPSISTANVQTLPARDPAIREPSGHPPSQGQGKPRLDPAVKDGTRYPLRSVASVQSLRLTGIPFRDGAAPVWESACANSRPIGSGYPPFWHAWQP